MQWNCESDNPTIQFFLNFLFNFLCKRNEKLSLFSSLTPRIPKLTRHNAENTVYQKTTGSYTHIRWICGVWLCIFIWNREDDTSIFLCFFYYCSIFHYPLFLFPIFQQENWIIEHFCSIFARYSYSRYLYNFST